MAHSDSRTGLLSWHPLDADTVRRSLSGSKLVLHHVFGVGLVACRNERLGRMTAILQGLPQRRQTSRIAPIMERTAFRSARISRAERGPICRRLPF